MLWTIEPSIHCKQSHVSVLINYSGYPDLNIFQGKAIAIDIDDQRAPLFPSIFIIHEMRVRGHNPFQPIQPSLPNVIPWQDWIASDDDLLLEPDQPTYFSDVTVPTMMMTKTTVVVMAVMVVAAMVALTLTTPTHGS